MKKFKLIKLTALLAAFMMIFTACSSSNGGEDAAEDTVGQDDMATVEITDLHGTVMVPVNPKNVVSLDSRTFETLADWGIELAAVPKPVMPADSPYVSDDAVQDVGSHGEPNLEVIAAVEPELVIVGQRFASFYDEIKALVPGAAVIDLNFDVSDKAATPGENLVNGLTDSTLTLGKIFDKNAEAEQLVAEFNQAIADAKESYEGETVMSVVVSGGEIGFSAPGSGRVWGPLYQVFGWTSALEVDNTSSDHKGDDVSVEAIAQSNPDWILVLDRDAAISSTEDSTPAADVIENSPALQNTTAVSNGQVVYAPADTYTNESIQTFIELFQDLASAFAK